MIIYFPKYFYLFFRIYCFVIVYLTFPSPPGTRAGSPAGAAPQDESKRI